MTRKLSLSLLFFAHLTILPGCQHLPYFGSTTTETPAKTSDRDSLDGKKGIVGEVTVVEPLGDGPKRAPQGNSTAFPRDDSSQIAAKLPQGQAQPIDKKQKPDEGITGIVTLEPGMEPSIPRAAGFQVAPGPLPELVEKKSEFEPIVMALQRMLEGRHQDAIKYLSTYEDDKQELFLRLLPPLATLVKKRMDELTTQEVAVLNKQYQGMIDSLRPRSELLVSRMCFCEEVRGYGWVRPLPENHAFLTGTESRIGELVQLYVELKNVASEPTKDGEYLTKLACSLELKDAAGKKVWSKSFEGNEATLRRSARLNDFYSRYGFYVPAIPAGKYELTLRIADETNPQARRIAEKSLVFQVTPVANQATLR
jgi:hypothetical protein